jgi:cation diffusion facilitator family transporter
VLAAKVLAFALTGSVALLSDAAESLVNVAAGVSVFLALRLAARPPDYEHPYGHAKAEELSSLLEGAMILVAAGAILAAAIPRLFAPTPLEASPLGLGVAAFATLLNAATAWRLRSWGHSLRSPALLANARHLMTDVWTSIGVIAAVVLVAWTGLLLLDPLLATAIGLHVLREGWRVLAQAFSSLLDARLPDAEEAIVIAALRAEGEVRGFHRLRSRRSGHRRFVEVDVFVAPSLDVGRAHAITARVEAEIARRLPDLTATLHVEPFVAGRRDTTLTPRQEFAPQRRGRGGSRR